MEELHLNVFEFASKATTNLHSIKGVDSKWFAENNNGLSSNGLPKNFQTLQYKRSFTVHMCIEQELEI